MVVTRGPERLQHARRDPDFVLYFCPQRPPVPLGASFLQRLLKADGAMLSLKRIGSSRPLWAVVEGGLHLVEQEASEDEIIKINRSLWRHFEGVPWPLLTTIGCVEFLPAQNRTQKSMSAALDQF